MESGRGWLGKRDHSLRSFEKYLRGEKIREKKRELRRRGETRRRARAQSQHVASALLAKNTPHGFRPNPRQEITITIPKCFSILQDPSQTLKFFRVITDATNDPNRVLIRVDYKKCEELSLCSSTILDVMLMAARRRRRRTRQRLEVAGNYASSQDINIMLAASGLPHHLEVETGPDPALSTIKTFELQQGTASHPEASKQRNRCGTELTDYFNDCLKVQGVELTDEGKHGVACLLTEIIGNAEEHGGQWFAIGFWKGENFEEEVAGRGELHIVIMDFGKTIYESLLDSPSDLLKSQLEQLSRSHQVGRFSRLLLGNQQCDEECLWTLYALQDRVSRFTGTPEGRDRGNGTIKMIEFFDQLAGDAPKRMCILSGHAYILFDGSYHVAPDPVTDLKVIAFNSRNDLHYPPDPKCVYRVNESFPGTVVSIRLTLDSKVLQQKAKTGRQEKK